MPDWDDVVRIGSGLAGVEESTWYRTPALKVRGKGFVRLRTEDDGLLVVLCSTQEKEALLASGDAAFSTTPHYDGHGSVLVDLDRVDAAQLAELVEEAWRIKAPAALRT
ncbi:MmcQ/YjbR family DNA-binding protein [Pseudonocardia sp. KRD-184]|uniref:MmcQ/YjbR family DNA-binding protein n=1 Tax=Pseudonocardia oceani TaxID=2792013 RepID=A0ABS6UBA9_9PSEU|nr:MmcQ/YjbR family DNA-binding protein [Pseudonocardia oceani]MBW0090899.1 MmcQ/YjbR family DNA-binding protein [Pseudonocardia oceani]MBW0098401.1 MmcQ/YjbR family DNA-binding protein [Pseudonocardia oceani]MBW0110608.1 MmcQ/YjbR family DNA-binding protein [Pseudonocardia oceani]MBW0122360.1 MmcQ/YjbR family DNA-binding protein [Pseudonocardia oceani]MBW0129149.1 MmcQ/YjbR family DNA-binding protein [Pseudonocardia oceani]